MILVSFMDVGDATSTTSMDVVKVGLEKQVGLELEGIQGWKIKNFLEKYPKKRKIELSLFELFQKAFRWRIFIQEWCKK